MGFIVFHLFKSLFYFNETGIIFLVEFWVKIFSMRAFDEVLIIALGAVAGTDAWKVVVSCGDFELWGFIDRSKWSDNVEVFILGNTRSLGEF